MENVKNLRIIAVDTSLGTNFLLSACEDATISELRGMIQKEHMSCFPEHESINVGSLLVDYSEKQYHVTDHLLIGQVFSNSWNKIHAVVYSGSSRAALFSNSPKPIEVQGFADGKLGTPGVCSDHRALVKSTGSLQNAKSKDSSFDRHSLSDEGPAHALLCQTMALDNCIETAPAMMVNLDFRRPSFSIEAPYTQPCSELDVITRAALSKGVIEYKSKRKKRKSDEQKIPVKKQKQGETNCQIICESTRDGEFSPDNVSARRTNEEEPAEKHGESLESIQPEADCRGDLNGKVILSKGDENLTNAYEEPNKNCIQHTGGVDNSLKNDNEQRENFFCTNTKSFVSSPGRKYLPSMILESCLNPMTGTSGEARSCRVWKKSSESSSSEKGFSNSTRNTRKTEEHTSQTSDKTGMNGCPDMSAGNRQEGTEEAFMNDGVQMHEMDLSRGYPVQLNDRTILLVASLSADVVPETQESRMESQDGASPGGRALEKGSAADSVERREMEALGLLSNQDARNMSTEELNCRVENENLKLKPLETAEQPEENNAFIKTRKLCDGHVDASCSGDSHNISVHGKRKKYKRRKVTKIDQVLMQACSRLVGLNNKEQGVEGDVDAQKMMQSLIETSNGKLESSCKLDINMVASEDAIIRSRDPESKGGDHEKRQKQSVDSCNESSPIAGQHIAKPRNVPIEPCFRTDEDGGKCIDDSLMEGCNTNVQENMCEKERTKTTHRKKKKRRKEPTSDHHNDAGMNVIHPNCEADPVYECVNNSIENDFKPSLSKKYLELPNELGLAVSEENELMQGELNLDDTIGGYQVAKRKSKRRKKVNTDTSICFTQEQDQNVDHANVNDTGSLSEDGLAKLPSACSLSKEPSQKSFCKDGVPTSSSPGSLPSKGLSQEGVVMTKEGADVFEFESSETVNRQNFMHHEATSNLEADNLDKLCSLAVKLVDDEILSPLKTTMRKTSRKIVHPKRWVTVLSDRLTWNQTSKSRSKKQRANKKSRRKIEVEMPSDGDSSIEACYADEEAKEGSGQVVLDDGRIACPFGCGRLYSKKTSAYYRHCKKCSGSDSYHST